MNSLQKKYETEIKGALKEEFKLSSIMQAPKITKIVINSGLKDAVSNSKVVDDAVKELGLITGQRHRLLLNLKLHLLAQS